jgi:hypothetical protein
MTLSIHRCASTVNGLHLPRFENIVSDGWEDLRLPQLAKPARDGQADPHQTMAVIGTKLFPENSPGRELDETSSLSPFQVIIHFQPWMIQLPSPWDQTRRLIPMTLHESP